MSQVAKNFIILLFSIVFLLFSDMSYNSDFSSDEQFEQFKEFVSDKLLQEKLSHVETILLEGFYKDNQKYNDMTEWSGYAPGHLKNEGAKLIKKIEEKTGLKINKKTLMITITKCYGEKYSDDKVSLENGNADTVDSESDLLYDNLEHFLQLKQWKAAEEKTRELLLYLTSSKSKGYLDKESILQIPCKDLLKIDRLWAVYSDNNYGFSAQAKIWSETGNRLNIKKEEDWTQTDIVNYLRFADSIGWLNPNNKKDVDFGYGEFLQYDELMSRQEDNQIKGSLPTYDHIFYEKRYYQHWHRTSVFFSYFIACKKTS